MSVGLSCSVARSSKVPAFVTPMAAVAVTELPEGDNWLYELKLDGYRALLIKHGENVTVQSRNQKDLTPMYPTVAAAGRQLKANQAIVDGEIVAVDDSGRPSFQALQHRSLHATHQIVFYAFDLLALNGQDLTQAPLTKRRAQLAKITPAEANVRLLQPLPGTAAEIVHAVRAMGLEGVIAKRKASPYSPAERSNDWQKLKLERAQEFVIGGYRLASPSSIDGSWSATTKVRPCASPRRSARISSRICAGAS